MCAGTCRSALIHACWWILRKKVYTDQPSHSQRKENPAIARF